MPYVASLPLPCGLVVKRLEVPFRNSPCREAQETEIQRERESAASASEVGYGKQKEPTFGRNFCMVNGRIYIYR